tara:strand:+ start:432 stop:956 length:525 start_codon:yes stop_codon:yes gene_type:complete
MSLFNRVNIRDIESHIHYLEAHSKKMNHKTIALNKKQVSFLKKYFKFQANLIRKVEKDNLMNSGYIILISKQGAEQDDMYVVLSKRVLYVVRSVSNVLKFRLVKDVLRLEYAIFPANAFSRCDSHSYLKFFMDVISMFRRVLDMPSQFIISTKKGVSQKYFEQVVQFSQIDKYL